MASKRCNRKTTFLISQTHTPFAIWVAKVAGNISACTSVASNPTFEKRISPKRKQEAFRRARIQGKVKCQVRRVECVRENPNECTWCGLCAAGLPTLHPWQEKKLRQCARGRQSGCEAREDDWANERASVGRSLRPDSLPGWRRARTHHHGYAVISWSVLVAWAPQQAMHIV